jgi:hypothetical protein
MIPITEYRSGQGKKEIPMSTDPYIWIAAILTLCIFSFLYKDNPLYRFGEHLFVGVAGGYSICIVWYNSLKPNLIDPLISSDTVLSERLLLFLPAVLSLLMLARLIPRIAWVSRFAMAFMVGISVGPSIPSTLQARVLEQIGGIVKLGASPDPTLLTLFNSLCLAVGTICGLLYFYFSREHKGTFGVAARVGIWFLMIGFGAAFGYTVMARISLLIGRILFLMRDWLGLVA